MPPSIPPSELLAAAVAHHQAGRLGEAAGLYRQILEADPRHADAMYLLGRIEHEQGRFDEAIRLLTQAVSADPREPTFHHNLGRARFAAGKFDAATAAYREALRLKPDYALVYNSLATALEAQGAFDEAEASLREAVRLKTDFHEAHNNLGALLLRTGRSTEARASLMEALRLNPELVEAHNNLGNALRGEGQFEPAIAQYRAALEIRPEYATAHYNLGLALRQCGRSSAALKEFQAAARLDPLDAQAMASMAASWIDLGKVDEAEHAARKAVEVDPDSVSGHSNLGVALFQQGQISEAITSYRAAIRLGPADDQAHSRLLFALNFDPGSDPASVFAEHRKWAQTHADPLTAQSPPHVAEHHKRRLRLGYVSPYFREHAVNYFCEPILASHDHAAFEVFCYSDVGEGLRDGAARRLQAYADHWRDIIGHGDERVAQAIRDDGIDILVDLSGHIGGNRLVTFARKPAPIQVTYLGYQSTTGMRAMDYRLTDAWADPPGLTDRYYTERLIRLPRSFFCYRPADATPDVSPLPALASGHVTFGAFNSFAKVTPFVIDSWWQILRRVPDSRLLVLAFRGQVEQRLKTEAAKHGIDPDRLDVRNKLPHDEYLRLLAKADIGLDPFPFNGHTTTCDSIWMGVPVVMLAGETYAWRFGGSVHTNVGLESLIAHEVDEYVNLAVDLARDLPRVSELRSQLRERMRRSVLLDAVGFTRDLEATYVKMWLDWCDSSAAMGR